MTVYLPVVFYQCMILKYIQSEAWNSQSKNTFRLHLYRIFILFFQYQKHFGLQGVGGLKYDVDYSLFGGFYFVCDRKALKRS